MIKIILVTTIAIAIGKYQSNIRITNHNYNSKNNNDKSINNDDKDNTITSLILVNVFLHHVWMYLNQFFFWLNLGI